MLHIVVTAGLQDVIEPYKVAFNIRVRIGYGVADTRLCRKVDNHGNVVVGKYSFKGIPVRNGLADKHPVTVERSYFLQPPVLDVDIIIVRDAVNADYPDVPNVPEQAFHEIAANESGRTGHKHCFAFEADVVLYHNYWLSIKRTPEPAFTQNTLKVSLYSGYSLR